MTRPGFAESIGRLQAAQKPNAGAPLYSVLVNRPLGRCFAAAAHTIGLTPNLVTAISAAFTYTAIALLALLPPSIGLGFGVAGLLMIGYALDAADGQLARLRGGGSLLGEWLDHVIDAGKTATLQLAVLVSFWRFGTGSDWWLAVPLVFCAVSTVHFFGFLLTELLERIHHARRGTSKPGRGGGSRLLAAAKLPTDYGLLCVVFALLGWPVVFFWVYTVLAVCTAAYTALVLPRWARRIAALDRVDRDG